MGDPGGDLKRVTFLDPFRLVPDSYIKFSFQNQAELFDVMDAAADHCAYLYPRHEDAVTTDILSQLTGLVGYFLEVLRVLPYQGVPLLISDKLLT